MDALYGSSPALPAPRATLGRLSPPAGALPSYILLGMMIALIAALVARLDFAVDRHDLPLIVAMQFFLLGVATLLRLRGFGRVGSAIEAAVLVLAATMATACLSVLVATIALPYRDAALARADALLFPWLDWRAMFALLHDRPRIVRAMCGIYQTLQWQSFLLVALLPLAGQERRCWQFVHAWFLTLIACVAIFPFVTAAGSYVHYGLTPADIPALDVDTAWRQVAVLEAIRSGAIHGLTPASMTGLISFPSFHAGGATLLAWGFRRIPIIGGAFVTLNIAVAATAPLIGAHYFVDILAGVALALVALHVARRMR